MEWWVAIFWGWCPTRYLQDPTVAFLNSHTEKLIFPTMSKTTGFGKNAQEILGIKGKFFFDKSNTMALRKSKNKCTLN
jgi:hypothetical protein